jgi:Brp/Blh family beta-carotene 15,15'-monooxygenase
LGKTHSKHTAIQVISGAAALSINLIFPEFIESIRFWFMAVVILIIGMPHGALDHIISYHSFPEKSEKQKKIWFYSYYTLIMVVYAILWLWMPLISFLIFLGITLYHFGQADAERFDLSGTTKKVLQYSRGLTIVGLIVYGSEPIYISEVIQVITGYDSLDLIASIDNYYLIPLFFSLIYPVTYLFVISFVVDKQPSPIYLADAFVVPALFAVADPFFAFAVYFGGWHSYNHAKTMLDYLNRRDLNVTMKWFYKKTLLLSLMSYAGLAILYFVTQAFGNEQLLIALLFILISVLTLPHIFIVEMMYRKY